MTHNQETNHSVESDLGMIETVESRDKDFKTSMVNVLRDLNENVNVTKG